MYHIYKTTNTVNGKYYIGVTNGNDPCYKGSGKALKLAIKKYGGKSFTFEVLESHQTEAEAYLREKEIVNEELVIDKNCYNLKTGGRGGAGQSKTEEHRRKISESVKQLHLQRAAQGIESTSGRPPAMSPEQTLEIYEKRGYRGGAEELGIKFWTFYHRVRRAQEKTTQQ